LLLLQKLKGIVNIVLKNSALKNKNFNKKTNEK